MVERCFFNWLFLITSEVEALSMFVLTIYYNTISSLIVHPVIVHFSKSLVVFLSDS